MTPLEALNKNSEIVKELNSSNGIYAKIFKEKKRETFNIKQQVRIANKENLKTVGKNHDRFQGTGVIKEIAGTDSYIVKSQDGKISKISHSDLKGICLP